jgi:quinoprotein dehydrogenase-associated probable ABC transporter substrate-binding protein
MYSASRLGVLLVCAGTMLPAAELRVCADPNNLPYSNQRGEGFENELARLAARDLGRTVRFVWATQRERYLRNLTGGRCDVVMGLPAGFDRVATTRPYYRSSYVFVSRRGHGSAIQSFDDAALKRARIGVHLLQHEQDVIPPAQALIDRGLANHIVWYKLYPDFTRPNPPAALIEAVERGEVDVAVAWGPMAGYFAERAPAPLEIRPVWPQRERAVPLAFDISMGVRQGDAELLRGLNGFIARRGPDIRRVLKKYGDPLEN